MDLLLERTILESLCFDNQSVVKIQRFNSFGPVKEYTDDLYFYLSSSPSHLLTSSDFFSFRLKVRASTFEYSESELFSLNMCCPRRKSPFNTPKQCWPPKKIYQIQNDEHFFVVAFVSLSSVRCALNWMKRVEGDVEGAKGAHYDTCGGYINPDQFFLCCAKPHHESIWEKSTALKQRWQRKIGEQASVD